MRTRARHLAATGGIGFTWRSSSGVSCVDLDRCADPPPKNPDLAAVLKHRPDVALENKVENRELDDRRLREAGIPVWVTVTEALPEFSRHCAGFADCLQLTSPAWLDQAVRVWDRMVPPNASSHRMPIWWKSEAFPSVSSVLVIRRLLTWYGPPLVTGCEEFSSSLFRADGLSDPDPRAGPSTSRPWCERAPHRSSIGGVPIPDRAARRGVGWAEHTSATPGRPCPTSMDLWDCDPTRHPCSARRSIQYGRGPSTSEARGQT